MDYVLMMKYAHPEVIVDTQWVEDHIKDANVRIAEVDYDPKANYELGHVTGAILFDWKQDINDPISRNIVSKQACEDLLQRFGINDETILILYGDFNNWFAPVKPDKNIRVFLSEVKESLGAIDRALVDVRSPKEFTGEILAPPE